MGCFLSARSNRFDERYDDNNSGGYRDLSVSVEVSLPPTLTQRPDGWCLDFAFTLAVSRPSAVVDLKAKNRPFGLCVGFSGPCSAVRRQQ